MPGQGFHPQEPHPANYEKDLNPNFMSGTNYDSLGQSADARMHSAYDFKELYEHPRLQGLDGDQLKAITILPEGTRLEQGATYLDLHKTKPQEFKAMGDMVAEKGHYIVPKKLVEYPLWNYLLGITNPERLDAANQ
jgi:hypothetical protein